jgi:hypothetical protein
VHPQPDYHNKEVQQGDHTHQCHARSSLEGNECGSHGKW